MVFKICKYCGKRFDTKYSFKVFCNIICQRRDYNERPEIREKNRIRIREFRKNNPEWKIRHKILARRYKEKRSEYWKEYGRRPEVRSRINEKAKIRRKTDKLYAIKDRLKRSFRHALTKYSKKWKNNEINKIWNKLENNNRKTKTISRKNGKL